MKRWRRRGGLGVVNVPTLTLLEVDNETLRYTVTWAGPNPVDWSMEFAVNGGAWQEGPVIPGADRVIDEGVTFGEGETITGLLVGRDGVGNVILGPVVSAPIVWVI